MMRNAPPPSSPPHENKVTDILEWLAKAHGRSAAEESEQLHRQLMLLREAPVPSSQRLKLLDLLYGQAERIIETELPRLNDVSLPVSRKIRHRVRSMLDMLSTLTQDYFNTLADLFDPEGESVLRTPQTTLRRAMHCLSWQIQINHLVASPTALGTWQQLHSAMHTARKLGLDKLAPPRRGQSIHDIYACILLSAIAQPASFSAEELGFITQYIEACGSLPEFGETPPNDAQAVFWIDLDKDFPAHALIRRTPSTEPRILYFSCDPIAAETGRHLSALKNGTSAVLLGLPAFADSRAGQAILKRLQALWGSPKKRRFTRRRQSYRVHLWAGLADLWQLTRHPENSPAFSEWMVTNESPDGYALMHMSGQTQHLRVGDIVALQATGEHSEMTPLWHICIVRWALSENPEHVELGLQLLASRAIAAEIAQSQPERGSKASALVLPATPPLRNNQSLIVPSGLLRENDGKIVLLIEEENLKISEVRTTAQEEQTGSIEMFSVTPDET